MAIKVDYTPVGQVYETARRAGSVQAIMDMDQRQQEQERFEMQLKVQQDAREFEARVRQEAATEDYQRTLAMAQAKSQIDFDSELQMYQKKRMLMMGEIEQIQASPILSGANKEELSKRAYAKHFGVTLGSQTMENFLAKEQYKQAVVKQLQEAVDGGMAPEVARSRAAAAGIPYSANMFPDKAEELRDDKNKLLVRLHQVQADLARFRDFNPWGPKGARVEVKDIETGEVRTATRSEVGIRDTLVRQAGELVAELEDLGQQAKVVPPDEVESVLNRMPDEYREGWKLAENEGYTFLEFLKKTGLKAGR